MEVQRIGVDVDSVLAHLAQAVDILTDSSPYLTRR